MEYAEAHSKEYFSPQAELPFFLQPYVDIRTIRLVSLPEFSMKLHLNVDFHDAGHYRACISTVVFEFTVDSSRHRKFHFCMKIVFTFRRCYIVLNSCFFF